MVCKLHVSAVIRGLSPLKFAVSDLGSMGLEAAQSPLRKGLPVVGLQTNASCRMTINNIGSGG